MDIGKLFSDVGASFSRVVQLTQESMGQSERTEYDPEITEMFQLADNVKKWTELIVSNLEAKMQPNPALRMQELLYTRMESQNELPPRPSAALGETMESAGNELGSNTIYGHALLTTGRSEKAVGNAEAEFVKKVAKDVIAPLQYFLKVEMVNINKERETLENCRLDLDIAKNKLKRAKEQEVAEAERQLSMAQTAFGRQLELTRSLLDGIRDKHGGSSFMSRHADCMKLLAEHQLAYHNACVERLRDLKNQMDMF